MVYVVGHESMHFDARPDSVHETWSRPRNAALGSSVLYEDYWYQYLGR